MDKKELNKLLKSTIASLKPHCDDARFFDMAMNRILSLKGQMGIEPTLVHIPIADIEETYKNASGTCTFTRTKNHIVVSFNGLKIIVSPWLESLTNHLSETMKAMSALADETKKKELTEEEVVAYQSLVEATAFTFSELLDIFADVELWLQRILRAAEEKRIRLEKMVEDAENPENLPDDNEMETELWRDMIEQAEKIQKEEEKHLNEYEAMDRTELLKLDEDTEEEKPLDIIEDSID